MYVIVEIAGLQYKVEQDQQIFVNRLQAEEGDTVTFDKVLLSDNGSVEVGAPAIDGLAVNAKVLKHLKGDKVIVFKKKRRKGYRVKNGFRASLTQLEIISIGAGTGKKAASKKSDEAKAAKPAAKKAAPTAKAKEEAKSAPKEAKAAPKAAKAKKETAAKKATEAKKEAPVKKEAPAKKAASAKKEAANKKEAPKKATAKKADAKGDDLTKVEGIGPKVKGIFNEAGINTFADLAAKSADELKDILNPHGGIYAGMTTDTWPKQAKMAAEGKWDELKKWQDELDGGKKA